MHPRQASLLTNATEVADRTAGKPQETTKQALTGGQAILWKYTDGDGNVFYLEEKKMSGLKSPYTGKSFVPKPERHTPQQVGKEMKEDAKADKSEPAAKTAAETVDRWKS
jgi:hypothetical protein